MRTVYTDGADVVGTATAAAFMPDSGGRGRGSSGVQSRAVQSRAEKRLQNGRQEEGRARNKDVVGLACIVKCLRAWSV
jgi:hypothetical protein